jgi:hypothetical protein
MVNGALRLSSWAIWGGKAGKSVLENQGWITISGNFASDQ